MRELSDTTIDIVLDQAAKRPTPTCVIYFQQLHGVASRIGSTETAFPHRFYHYDCGPWAIWHNPADTDRCIKWARQCWEALKQSYEPSAYVNAVDDAVSDDEERVKSAYGQNYHQLAELKAKYDPTNQFRLNANIRPASSSQS
jgi:hypothetical protein